MMRQEGVAYSGAMNASGQQACDANGFDDLMRHYRVPSGRFDELRACGPDQTMTGPGPDPVWSQLLGTLRPPIGHELDQRLANVRRQVHDNGVTYNVYADAHGTQRPWSLDLLPLLLSPDDWQHLEAGVRQRARLNERLMRDLYGPQTALAEGLLPAALVHGHPGYLRALHGTPPVGGRFLHLQSFDLARGPDGLWWLVGQRTQAPSGLGYLLENRLIVADQFAAAFELMPVQRLADSYRMLIDGLRAHCPGGPDAHLALLSPGPYNETYFEHAYLARYLGLTLVQGSDLVVRQERLYLKTIKGLVPVHGLLKRVDDDFLDPLELRADSTLGVPGLLQAIRAGNVLVANTPGSAYLESAALLGFLPALAQHWLQQELLLPALPTWWCGEHSAMEQGLAQLAGCVIKPSYPRHGQHHSFEPVLGSTLSPDSLQQWGDAIRAQPAHHCLQTYLPLSHMPTWRSDASGRMGLQARAVMLRVFALGDAQNGWQVLPGGLARVAPTQADLISMQSGGSSADVWALSASRHDHPPVQAPHLTPPGLMQRQGLITSTAAENLFWIGRYTERVHNATRLAQLCLSSLHNDNKRCDELMHWLGTMARANTLVDAAAPSPGRSSEAFEQALISSLARLDGASSVGFYLGALKSAASRVRERLSLEHWRRISQAEASLQAQWLALPSSPQDQRSAASALLESLRAHMAGVNGAQTDRMVHDDGWRLLHLGRHIERLSFMASSWNLALACGCLSTAAGLEALMALFDGDKALHKQLPQDRALAALIDSLLLDTDNPRSLAWVSQTLRTDLALLPDSSEPGQPPLSQVIPDPAAYKQHTRHTPTQWPPDGDSQEAAHDTAALQHWLKVCVQASVEVSNQVSARYFTHTQLRDQSLGTA
jgi:uncharacterized circularly permuted ATP-grasp superfamily protein/uncharacterized alpha-E superfamily protein